MRRLFLGLVTLILSAQSIGAQIARTGLGGTYGLAQTSSSCSDCDGSESGIGGFYKVHWFASNQLSVGIEASDFRKSWSDGLKQSDAFFTFSAQYYPSNEREFFISGGIGRGRSSVDDGYDFAEITGLALSVGAGYDAHLSKSYYLTPFIKLNSTMSGRLNVSGSTSTGVNATLFQLGVGITER
jgi:hypothetical protein